MTITVRAATIEDIPWLLGQLAQFATFFGSSRSLFPSAEQADATLHQIIAQHPFLVAELPGPASVATPHPIGFICGALLPHPYNPAITVLSELFWWVTDAYRGSRAGLVLLNAFVAIGTQQADWIVMTLEADSPINPETLFRRGFRPKETSFLLEVE